MISPQRNNSDRAITISFDVRILGWSVNRDRFRHVSAPASSINNQFTYKQHVARIDEYEEPPYEKPFRRREIHLLNNKRIFGGAGDAGEETG